MSSSLVQLSLEATLLKRSGKYQEALAVRLVLEQRFDAQSSNAKERASNLNMIAFLSAELGDLTAAENAARKCLALYEPHASETDGVLATYFMALAAILAESGKFEEALQHGETALRHYVASGHGTEYLKSIERDVDRIRNRDSYGEA